MSSFGRSSRLAAVIAGIVSLKARLQENRGTVN